MKRPLDPVHVTGIDKGEEYVLLNGREPGRGGRKSYRSARDSTSIDSAHKGPIHPAMPHIPPS